MKLVSRAEAAAAMSSIVAAPPTGFICDELWKSPPLIRPGPWQMGCNGIAHKESQGPES